MHFSPMASKTIAVVCTLDTKGAEADFLRAEVKALGGKALILDLSVIGDVQGKADYSREQIAKAGGADFAEMTVNPTREKCQPIMIAGAVKIINEGLASGEIHGVLGIGGTQGTSMNGAIFQQLPYGFPKLILSTAASGDTSAFVGIKDIAMMYSVSDILGLNSFSEKILANAAASVLGMAQVKRNIDLKGAKGIVGITNLGVLTKGTMLAMDLLEKAGYKSLVFHAIGSGGDAMEQMVKDGIITAVLDYACGDVGDGVFGALRGASADRLTTAGKLKVPQVIIPGGSEHLGVLTEANVVPDAYKDHKYMTWHSPVVFVPRVNEEEQAKIAAEVAKRLEHTTENAKFLMPLNGVSAYSKEGSEIHAPELDASYWEAFQKVLPEALPKEALDNNAEDTEFVEYAVKTLIELIENAK